MKAPYISNYQFLKNVIFYKTYQYEYEDP